MARRRLLHVNCQQLAYLPPLGVVTIATRPPDLVRPERHPDGEASVGDDERPGHVAGLLRREEADDRGDVRGLREAAERDVAQELRRRRGVLGQRRGIRVRTMPGATALIRMPWRARSSDAARTNETTAPLLAV